MSGHLWWQRWSPQDEVSAGFVLMDDNDMLDDWFDHPEDVANEVGELLSRPLHLEGCRVLSVLGNQG